MNGRLTKWRLAFIAGICLLVVAVWVAVVIPSQNARLYATIWTGAVTLAAAVFVVGYAVFSLPSRDENGKRQWVAEWFWLPTLPTVALLSYGVQLAFRLIIPAPLAPTVEQILAQRYIAGTAAIVFFLLSWLVVMWARRQVGARRARRDGAG